MYRNRIKIGKCKKMSEKQLTVGEVYAKINKLSRREGREAGKELR